MKMEENKRKAIPMTLLRGVAAIGLLTLLPACSTVVGPNSAAIKNAPNNSAVPGIRIIELTQDFTRAFPPTADPGFAETLGNPPPLGTVIGPGDVLEISIWEAPPATLFSSQVVNSSIETARSSTLPPYEVGQSGRIGVPFAGSVPVVGRTLLQVEKDITERLSRKAHLPQVTVRLVRSISATVSVIGEVNTSTRMPLTQKGEHLLDALAAAGGTKQSVDKMTVQITRGAVTQSMPLQTVIRDPRQNIALRADDVVTAIYRPYSFTALGASTRTDEILFEATGLTLAQALGRIGGLQDGRADPKGVYLFRWEDPSKLPPADAGTTVTADANGRVPVIYKINMRDPAIYFAMQNFYLHDRDVVYVATSQVSEFQRFLSIMASTVLPIVAVDNAVNR
jgi:polysaccharide export outer membrane protein